MRPNATGEAGETRETREVREVREVRKRRERRDPTGRKRRLVRTGPAQRASARPRAPVAGPRMLPRRSAETTPAGRPASLRMRVPDRILRMTEFGLRHTPPEPDGERDAASWWRHVERELEQEVFAHVPAAARDVELRLDADALEVVVEYALPT